MNVFKFEVKRNLKSCLLWSIICSVLILLFLSVFPSMKDSGMQDLVGTKLDALPTGMLKAFGLESMIDFTNILEYLAYCFQYIAMAACIYALILGVNSLLEEEASGTIEFLYAKNISRKEIVRDKVPTGVPREVQSNRGRSRRTPGALCSAWPDRACHRRAAVQPPFRHPPTGEPAEDRELAGTQREAEKAWERRRWPWTSVTVPKT